HRLEVALLVRGRWHLSRSFGDVVGRVRGRGPKSKKNRRSRLFLLFVNLEKTIDERAIVMVLFVVFHLAVPTTEPRCEVGKGRVSSEKCVRVVARGAEHFGESQAVNMQIAAEHDA